MPLAATGPTGTTTAGAIGAAYAQLMAAGYVPDGIVFDGAAAGVLIGSGSLGLAADFNPQTGTLWGMRMAAITGSMGGNFLIGQFAGNSILLEREEITATIALMNEDDFTHNLATVRVEERSVLAVINYGAFLKCAVV
jgi:Phage capsid family.